MQEDQTRQTSTVKQSTATHCDSGRDLSYLIGVMLDWGLLLQQCSQRKCHGAAIGHWSFVSFTPIACFGWFLLFVWVKRECIIRPHCLISSSFHMAMVKDEAGSLGS